MPFKMKAPPNSPAYMEVFGYAEHVKVKDGLCIVELPVTKELLENQGFTEVPVRRPRNVRDTAGDISQS